MPRLRLRPTELATLVAAACSLGCGLVDERSGNADLDDETTAAALAWCDEEGVGEVAKVILVQDLVEDAVSSQLVILLDAEGRLLVETRDLGGAYEQQSRYVRDENGKVVAQTYDRNADGLPDRVTRTTYDEENRPLLQEEDEDNDGTVDEVTTWDYSTPGQGRSVTDEGVDGIIDSIDVATFSESGQLLRVEEDLDGNGTADIITTYAYADDGQPTEFTSDHDGDGIVDVATMVEYGNDEEILRVTQADYDDPTNGSVTTYEYDDAGRLMSIAVDYGAEGTAEEIIELTYDGQGRELRRQTRTQPGGEVVSVDRYEYDEGVVRTLRDSDGDGRVDRMETRANCN